ncbi:MAG: GNAT family N-acetyltransferase [Firmicutes bacterium]|jgi:RimJ/RimL family protein N-acetyltransferase|nr:GNAT family N-acetyltransferase [Bacillota bacterium]
MREGDKAVIRPLVESDLPKLAAWDQDPEIARLMGGTPRDGAASRERYQKLMRDRNSVAMAIEGPHGDLIGEIELTEIAWRSGDAELIIRIGDRRFWGRGYGTDAVAAMLDVAFEEMNLRRVYLRVCEDNPRATKCYEKCGFRREGVVSRRLGDGQEPRVIVLMTIMREDYLRLKVAS